MKIHLRQIPQGDTLRMAGEENPDRLGLEESGVRALSPLAYDLEAGVSAGGLFVTGSLYITVELECVASLERFPHDVAVENFAVQIPLEGNECVDLTEQVREDIFLALPPYPRKPGVGSVDVTSGGDSPQTPGSSAWSALDDIGRKRKRT